MDCTILLNVLLSDSVTSMSIFFVDFSFNQSKGLRETFFFKSCSSAVDVTIFVLFLFIFCVDGVATL